LMWLGFLPGLLATIITGLYSAKEIPKVAEWFAIAESNGVTLQYQKIGMCVSWATLCLFMFVAMITYASQIPDSLGIGPVILEGSYGVLRLCFLLSAMCGALLTTNLFELWNPVNVSEAWAEFAETELFTAKKALYLVLMVQAVLYLLLSVQVVAWEVLLVFICGYYLDAKVTNLMLLYLVLVGVSILLDLISICYMPAFSDMSSVDAFGNTIFIIIFLLKFCTVGIIYLYEKECEKEGPYVTQLDDNGHADEDDIAE